MPISAGGNELINPFAVLEHLGIESGSNVADLGCGGAGHFIIPAAQIVGTNTVVYAVDILKSVLHTVSSKARLDGINNIRTVWSNLEKIGATNIPAESLDFTMVINMLFLSNKRKEVLTEATRLTKPGGKILVIDWNNSKTPIGPLLDHRVPVSEIKKIGKDLKLKLIEEFKPGNYHYGLIFEK